VFRAVAKASCAAAHRARAGQQTLAEQHRATLDAAETARRNFAAPSDARIPCFMCGKCFGKMLGHWRTRVAEGGTSIKGSNKCAKRWRAPGADALVLAEVFLPAHGAGGGGSPEGDNGTPGVTNGGGGGAPDNDMDDDKSNQIKIKIKSPTHMQSTA
jgi:hypothetical protein